LDASTVVTTAITTTMMVTVIIRQYQHLRPGSGNRNNQAINNSDSVGLSPSIGKLLWLLLHFPSLTVNCIWQVDPSRFLTPDQATVEMPISSNLIAAVKITPPIDESVRQGGEKGGI
jgi:hypothetical protein